MESPTLETPKVFPERIKSNSQNKTYEIEDVKINACWKEFAPISQEKTSSEISSDEAILFLPGWSARNAKTLDHLSQMFAEDSGKTVFLITTRAEKVIPDSLYKEAKAIRNLIVEKGLKKVILAAHSEGGIKVVDLIDILQKENQNIGIQGLILLDPVGLYEQNRIKFASQFGLDMLVNTPITLTKNLLKNPSLVSKAMQASSDIIFNMAREMAKTKIVGYPNKLWNQIATMAEANTHYKDVKCPIVLIQGKQDPVSSPEKVILAMQDPKFSSGREQIFKKTFFPNSQRVFWIVPFKLGHHGMPHFREDSVSNVAIGLLKRYWRKQQSSTQITDQAQ